MAVAPWSENPLFDRGVYLVKPDTRLVEVVQTTVAVSDGPAGTAGVQR